MRKVGFFFVAAILISNFVGAQATPQQVAFTGIVVKGAVVRDGAINASLLEKTPREKVMAKVAKADGGYRCTAVGEGIRLLDLLDRIEIKKKVDDGFNRPLDTYIVVKGRSGELALFSWGEVFAGLNRGPVLADQITLYFPHHHEAVEGYDGARLFTDAERSKLDLKNCAVCHDGSSQLKLSFPRGVCLLAPEDGFAGRFVEDVVEINVFQVGIPVLAKKDAGKEALVESIEASGPAHAKLSIGKAGLAKRPRIKFTDATIGMGRGFHGMHTSEGVDLGAALLSLVPKGIDPRRVWVLVTAADGYRSLFSGCEVFTPSSGRGVILSDQEDGKPYGKGDGRFRVVVPGDFFVDRSVRLVKEIHIGTP